jgi:hypothetical protein
MEPEEYITVTGNNGISKYLNQHLMDAKRFNSSRAVMVVILW